MKFPVLLLALALAPTAGRAEKLDPAKWSMTLDPEAAAPGSKVLARLAAKIEPGWHLYSLSTPAGGPIPTTIRVPDNPAIANFRIFEPKPKRAYDPNFQLDTETYEGEPVFLIELELKKGAVAGRAGVNAAVRYQMCNDRMCLPPVNREAAATLMVDAGAKSAAFTIPAGYIEFKPGSAPGAARATAPPSPGDERGFGFFVLTAFGFGLAAIFTPCVFPMIPITMSYFLNRPSGSRREGVVQAAIFCAGIVVLFSGLGLAATLILGPFGIVQLGSNPWVNGFIAAIFLVFGLSLLGAFEITIPSSVLTKLDRVSQKGGTAGTLIMGLTFSLASFACVGPFVGTLLAASVGSGGTRPLAGMIAFSAGLASPFFLLAMFPSYLKKMPKSGGWLARVKVVLGFIILAAMLKYLASVDQVMQWNLLTRERFLAAWIVLFAMAGLYLLGYVRLEGVGKDELLGLWRLLIGMCLVGFAISLAPGMFGGRLGELDAYVPPASATSGFSLGGGETGLVWMKNQLPEAMARARREEKLVLANFTGYACTNCHWMKANMFTRPEIRSALGSFVLVDLFTDGTDEASRRNEELEEKTFGTAAIPYYAIFDADGKIVASFPGLTRNPQEFLAFLNRAPGGKPAVVASASLPGLILFDHRTSVVATFGK
ncbi:MAG TPA: cytochrome c biogenesis protein CcdA [Bryobacteraceae bacterium]|nr:cytochrome c biogenesis protein CcdA [Bryobacteraceae bacterium]